MPRCDPRDGDTPRHDALAALQSGEVFDLLVIGGGATGCGIALDAAGRGLRTALVERFDFAEGTSGRSTKLVHGGVRYLEAAVRHLDPAQYHLVRDALRERWAFLANAPHLCDRLPLITPLYSWAEVPYVYAGLTLYDLLSGKRSLGRSRLIGRAEALARCPMLKAEGLKAAVLYYDGQFVDTRMALALAMTARRDGAVVANHLALEALIHDDAGTVVGARLRDGLDGASWPIAAKAVINATGPFADHLRKMDDPGAKPILRASSGVHIVLEGRFAPPDGGVLIPKTDDGRVLFILPWQGHALVGTTEGESEVVDHPPAKAVDVAYLLGHLRRSLALDVTEGDVLSVWAGVRPLVFDPEAAGTAQLARDHVIIEDPSGLITITGGKWTTYRKMAEQAVDRAVARGGLAPARPCATLSRKVIGGEDFKKDGAAALVGRFALAGDIAGHLHRAYGDRAPLVAELAARGAGARLHPDHPYIEAEVVYAATLEAAEHGADVLVRRLTLALVDRAAARAAAPRVIALLGDLRGWDAARRAAETALLDERLSGSL
ncbi:glycerol-3-phosphate dehydrogenase [Rhodospirillum rubrum]|uniref:FAD-dependent oxidoreductase n=1 Tax=Rhodospirillum rubrum TaxID=1085 RepID=UPI0019068703|nr:FAD-dependent oxidoreductase [Rhodospirillum rubrum]MBK1663155.1 glycerol-3-phosphate dehydrogenase [Rhodospirillum rubrum]MBK1675172.1 glycerol-3-phosphate dehydrogenase [Rhodospirillum rubrum]